MLRAARSRHGPALHTGANLQQTSKFFGAALSRANDAYGLLGILRLLPTTHAGGFGGFGWGFGGFLGFWRFWRFGGFGGPEV